MTGQVDVDDTSEDGQYVDHPRAIEEVELSSPTTADITVTGLKITEEPDKAENSPLLDSSRGPSFSNSAEQTSDVASTHSLPVVHVSEPQSPTQRQPARSGSTPATSLPSPAPSLSHFSSREGNSSASAEERAQRRRSAVEIRSSNRLSGFFNHLIHRRDHLPVATSMRSPNTIAENQPTSSVDEKPPESRASSPPPRAVTPPPELPPPSLRDLGLSLSVVTSDLAPSHFSTPPSSGAFLAPHYLLLCHAQGLDVLPLVSPPLPQPYALVRRVSFKSVVVMEQRGVLVAIAGRRDGVRVYALEEVKKAVEWRVEVEVRRERERTKRETVKKMAMGTLILDHSDHRDSSEKNRKQSLSTPPPGEARVPLPRKGSHIPTPPVPPIPPPLIPRTPTVRRPKSPRSAPVTAPSGLPPPYSGPLEPHPPLPPIPTEPPSSLSSLTRSRAQSVTEMLITSSVPRRIADTTRSQDSDAKDPDWVESSDDEAINVVAAGSSGSQALDERTSSRHSGHSAQPSYSSASSPPESRTSINRRNRPANLDLSLSRSATINPPEPSPAPTLMTLRQALSHSPPEHPDTPVGEGDDDEEEADDSQISLTQALMESRIPDLPPMGSTRSQQAILISSHLVATGDDEPSSPGPSEAHSMPSRTSNEVPPSISSSSSQRRRWSVILNPLGNSNTTHSISESTASAPVTAPPTRERTPRVLSRSHSFRSHQSASSVAPSPSGNGRTGVGRPASASNSPYTTSPSTLSAPAALPESASVMSAESSQSSRSRFLPRIISNAFQNRRSEDRSKAPKGPEGDTQRRVTGVPLIAHAPPPKLEYVKLPGTKGALMVKAVETAKKSFLAILCGESGEKVELFAGTYRTALGLSRTFILPDSPRSLELQLQGDDLVEVFLVFSQNVFGLEPATVRVREVRIGRAERRAARRRARETRTGESAEGEGATGEEDTNVNVSIGVSVSVGPNVVATGTPPLIPSEHPEEGVADQDADRIPETPGDGTRTPAEAANAASLARTEELVAVATAQMGPYTTFQQLSFAPNFPLASIADDYVIPPTYPEFIEYRAEYEPEESSRDLSQVQFSPPGLPVPLPTAPSKWYYRDPKNVIHGPWKASLMQAWYKDGLLPPDLPVRREEDTEYMLLKDLRLQSVDPTHPFRNPPAQGTSSSLPTPSGPFQVTEKPLLKPISLLAQPRHFGPPALFFSTRGGHSTAIVDARGRSVLKGRFVWSGDGKDDDPKSAYFPRMGDVKRLEALDVKDRSVLVAMRQGGLEAVDLGDALLKPGDESRTMLPQYCPPISSINRRGPFVWKIGTPVGSSSTSATVLSSKSKGGASSHLPGKKMNTGISKSPAGRTEFATGDTDVDGKDEVLFLGRMGDEIYICERNQGAFRILKLCPNQ